MHLYIVKFVFISRETNWFGVERKDKKTNQVQTDCKRLRNTGDDCD